mmetsp:Transcript_114019/g.303071  ORF Transcript_114019/g.303071 Transcript_114019/m.303071 type:complete len:320 (-) Transcript_114019:89-1048(-)
MVSRLLNRPAPLFCAGGGIYREEASPCGTPQLPAFTRRWSEPSDASMEATPTGATDELMSAGSVDKAFKVYLNSQDLKLCPTPLKLYRPAYLHKELQDEATDLGFDLLGSELCFALETSGPLEYSELRELLHLFHEIFTPAPCAPGSFLSGTLTGDAIFEADPWQRSTAVWLADATAMCIALGIKKVARIRLSYRYQAKLAPGQQPPDERQLALLLRCPGAASIGPISMPKLPGEPETPPPSPPLLVMDRARKALCALSALDANEGAAEDEAPDIEADQRMYAERNMRLVRARVFQDALRRDATFRRVRSWCHAEAGAD